MAGRLKTVAEAIKRFGIRAGRRVVRKTKEFLFENIGPNIGIRLLEAIENVIAIAVVAIASEWFCNHVIIPIMTRIDKYYEAKGQEPEYGFERDWWGGIADEEVKESRSPS